MDDVAEFEAGHGVIPIQIRADRYVRVHGIDSKFSRAEAEKVCRVIMALANEENPHAN